MTGKLLRVKFKTSTFIDTELFNHDSDLNPDDVIIDLGEFYPTPLPRDGSNPAWTLHRVLCKNGARWIRRDRCSIA